MAFYRAVPGLQLIVALHPGDWSVSRVMISGAGLDHAGFDQSGLVYLIHLTPTDERVTVGVKLSHDIPPLPAARFTQASQTVLELPMQTRSISQWEMAPRTITPSIYRTF